MLQNPLLRTQQNLTKQVSAEAFIRPAGFYKSIGLEILGICAALGTGYLYRSYLFGNLPLAWVVGALAAFGTFSVLGVLLSGGPARRTMVIVFEVAGFLLFFYDQDPKTLLLLAAVLFAGIALGEVLARREYANGVEIKFSRISKSYLKKVSTAAVIAGIVLYLPQWNVASALPPRAAFDTMYGMSAAVLQNFYPELRLTGSVENFAQTLALSELKKREDFLRLPQSTQEQMINSARAKTVEALGEILGVAVKLTDELPAVFYAAFKATFEEWHAKFGEQFLLVWAFALFLVLRTFAIAFYLATGFIAFMVYQILLAGNVVMIAGETRTRETVQYT